MQLLDHKACPLQRAEIILNRVMILFHSAIQPLRHTQPCVKIVVHQRPVLGHAQAARRPGAGWQG